MENTTEQPKKNDLIYINGELFHEIKSKVNEIHVTQTHVLSNNVIIFSNEVDMLNKGMIKVEQDNDRFQKLPFVLFKNVLIK